MSLHAIANHMASKGRGPDTMLIHMAPSEVQGLQALAKAHGGSLTVNPDTGLPEAGFLDKLLPTIIGAGLTYFSGGAINPMMAAGIVGGVQAARTGDIGKGLSAGLGAYGGAGMASSFAGAGVDAMTTAGVGDYAKTLAAQGLEAGTPEFGAAASELALNAQKEAIAAPFADKLSTGFDAVTKNPASAGAFLKDNAKSLMYAAGPAIMAGANVENKLPQTVTKPGMIRPYSFDPYGGRYTAYTPYEASPVTAAGGGLMGMDDGGYSPGELDFAERSEPVVRMAAGGVSDAEIQNWMAANKGADDKTIAAAMQQYGVSTDQLSSAMGYNPAEVSQRYAAATAPAPTGSAAAQYAATHGIDLNKQISNWAQQNPNASDAMIDAQMQQYGISNEDVARALGTSGGSQAMQWSALAGDQGLSGLNQNILGWLKQNPNAKMADAVAAMRSGDINEADVIRATGRSLAELYQQKKTPIVPGPIETVPFLPDGVSGGGNTRVNPNGTITTTPNIPGRPEGGFTGMGQLKDIYEQGGGSLGYTPYVPTSIADFEEKYNRTSRGSKQAYDYLMGEGDYPLVPYTSTGEIQKPYWESVGRFPTDITTQKYLFQNGRYVENPDFVPPTYTQGAKPTGLSFNEVLKGIEPFKNATDDAGLFDFVTENNIAERQVADALGISLLEARARLKAAKAVKETPKTVVQEDLSTGAAAGGVMRMALGGLGALARGGSASQYNLGDYSDGGRLLRGPGDGVSDSIPASIGNKRPARLADGEFVVPARIVSELGNGSTEAGARKLYAMMDRVQKARGKTTGKKRVATNTRADKHLPA